MAGWQPAWARSGRETGAGLAAAVGGLPPRITGNGDSGEAKKKKEREGKAISPDHETHQTDPDRSIPYWIRQTRERSCLGFYLPLRNRQQAAKGAQTEIVTTIYGQKEQW